MRVVKISYGEPAAYISYISSSALLMIRGGATADLDPNDTAIGSSEHLRAFTTLSWRRHVVERGLNGGRRRVAAHGEADEDVSAHRDRVASDQRPRDAVRRRVRID